MCKTAPLWAGGCLEGGRGWRWDKRKQAPNTRRASDMRVMRTVLRRDDCVADAADRRSAKAGQMVATQAVWVRIASARPGEKGREESRRRKGGQVG